MELKFDKKKHRYYLDTKELTSVTNFVKKFFKPFDVKKIAKYVAKNRRNKGEKITATQVKKEWKGIAQAGTDIHQEIEDWIMCQTHPLNNKAIQGMIWFEDIPEFDHVKCEEIVWSEELGLAGTIDCMIVHGDNSVTLVDWKTNKAIKKGGYNFGTLPPTADIKDGNLNQYTLQLSCYAYILEKEYGYKIRDLVLVHLKDDRTIPYEVEYKKDTIKEMIKWQKEHKLE